MKQYYKLKVEEYKLKKKLNVQKKIMNKNLRKEYKNLFRVADMMIIFIVIFNVGALLITNALVVKVEPDKPFYEVAPVAAKNLDAVHIDEVAPANTSNKLLLALIFNMVIYTVILANYLWVKYKTFEASDLVIPGSAFVFLFFAVTFDFINDLGYLIGVLIWGG